MYIDKTSSEYYYKKTLKDWPSDNRILEKKIQLTDHFIDYMRNNLLTAGTPRPSSADDFARIPYLKKWERVDQTSNQHNQNLPEGLDAHDTNCIAFLLTNGVFQCNFHKSHVKVIICPLMKAITFLNFNNYSDRTFSVEELIENGCDAQPFFFIEQTLFAAVHLMQKCRQDEQDRQERRNRREQRARQGRN